MLTIPLSHQKLSAEHLQFLKIFSTSCRRTIIEMLDQSQSGHPGGSLSCVDYLTLLYVFIISQTGEKVVVSNGHISPAVYSVLAELGYLDKKKLIATFRQTGSMFEGHVSRHVSGVWYGTGPLGIGGSVAAGLAHAAKIKESAGLASAERIFLLLGDGECDEGQVYEMMHYAKKYRLNNLIAFVDFNRIQLSGPLQEVMPIDLLSIFRSAHWNVVEVNGHDYAELWDSIAKASEVLDTPTVLLASTIMGKGVDFMENDSLNNTYNWHGVAPNHEQTANALKQLELTAQDQLLLDIFRKKTVVWKPKKPFSEQAELPVLKPVPPNIVSDTTDCRSAYGTALKNLADHNPHIVALTADLGGSVKTDSMKKNHPDRVFDCGIAEQHMVSCSAGFALQGYIPFCSTFGAFMTSRAKDQARVNDINRTNVKMVATHCGLSVGEDGPTHQAIDDLGSFDGFFHTTLLEPCDPNQCDHMIRFAAEHFGNFYIRMGRSKIPAIMKKDGNLFFDDQYQFVLGQFDLLREGTDLTILASGPMVHQSWRVLDKLQKQFSIELIVMNSLSHLDDRLLSASLRKTKKAITIEDHNPKTGYGQAIAAWIARNGLVVNILSMGVTAYQLSGKAEELYEKAGLGEKSIEEKVLALMKGAK